MKKIFTDVFVTALILVIFVNISSGQEMNKNNTLKSKLDIYRHYRGTIGGRPAILDLRYGIDGGSNFGGSPCYYLDSCELMNIIALYPGIPTVFFDSATEFIWGTPMIDLSYKKHPTWQVHINDDKITGKRYAEDRIKSSDINLTEDYSDAYPMDVMRYRDTISVIKSDGSRCSASGIFIGVKPSSKVNNNDANFINNALSKVFDVDKWEEYPKLFVKKCLIDFAGNKEELHTDSLLEGMGYSSYVFVITIFPVYNENGLLVLEVQSSGRRLSNRKNFHSYLCFDVKGKKRLFLNDILNVKDITQNKKIAQILKSEARKKYKMGSIKKLNKQFFENKINVTDNVAISHYGINFCYDRNQIAADEVSFFIPYTRLRGILTEDFKKRIGL